MDELTFEKYVSLIQSMSVNMQMGKIDKQTYISNLEMIVEQLKLSNNTNIS